MSCYSGLGKYDVFNPPHTFVDQIARFEYSVGIRNTEIHILSSSTFADKLQRSINKIPLPRTDDTEPLCYKVCNESPINPFEYY